MEEEYISVSRQHSAAQSILAVGVLFIVVCILLFRYGFPLLDIVVVFLIFGLPAEYVRRRGQSDRE